MTKISLINLGCPKNLVDSEIILGLAGKAGMRISDDTGSADVLLLNTCAFIKEAKEESIDLILELAKFKKKDQHKKLIVMGCLPQRYLKELVKELPEVDRFVTFQEMRDIASIIKDVAGGNKTLYSGPSPAPSSFVYDADTPRGKITAAHFAYIKIADGCSNRCSYCAIPNIKGDYKSQMPDSVIKEARNLIQAGVREINIIAQDTTNYGKDNNTGVDITELLRRICEIAGDTWIRLIYTHPAHITDNLIKEIKKQDKICKYIDIPLQHIDDDILKSMGRKIDSSRIKKLLKKIREEIPNVVIRTSFIVGFPGETEEKFQTLLDFMNEFKFERLGVFMYSDEDGTPASKMGGQISKKVKEERFHKAMRAQNNIARDVNKSFMGRILDALVDYPDESGNKWLGRTYADAPDVDGLIYIHGNGFKPGDMVKVRITDTMDYDLVGEPVKKTFLPQRH